MPHINIVDTTDLTVTIHGATPEAFRELRAQQLSGNGVRVKLDGDSKNTFYSIKEIFWPSKEIRRLEYVEGPNGE